MSDSKDTTEREAPRASAPPADASSSATAKTQDGDSPPWLRDLMASLVVFLVALPLCIGIAVACGVPAERGLLTGMVGGAIGVISGAPLLVSGPAASLIVPVFDVVANHGLIALAPVVMLAGFWQALAGRLHLGQWFRAVAPAVITGMLVGIGALICASQALVALDLDPKATFMANLAAVPGALVDSLAPGGNQAPFWITLATIALIMGWTRFRPKFLSIIPGHLVSLLTVSATVAILAPEVRFLDISSNFFEGLRPPKMEDFSLLLEPKLFGISLVFAFVASAATLLTANAIDERQTITKTDYDKEMFAQGVGNMTAGAFGGLPMTGVIVRSSVNVEAGARTRRSTILHALWILSFVVLAPELLELIPKASLGAILVYTGIKLIDISAMEKLWKQGRLELAICLLTFVGVVFLDLFVGILIGLGAAAAKIVFTFARLEVRAEDGPPSGVRHLHLIGSATFFQLPRLARELDAVPDELELHVHIDRLDHIDHACLQLLSGWGRRREAAGQPGMVVEWDELADRYRNAIVGSGPGDGRPSASVVSLVWAEWKKVYASPDTRERAQDLRWHGWIDEGRIALKVETEQLDGVLSCGAEMLASAAGLDPVEVYEALSRASDGHVPLGGGISLPHTTLPGLDRSYAAVVTTARPLAVGASEADLFFVLVSPRHNPGEHLQALAHIGRMCHHSPLLTQIRSAPSPGYAALLLDALGRRTEGTTTPARYLATVVLHGKDRARRFLETLGEAFSHPVLVTPDDGERFQLMRAMVAADADDSFLMVPIDVEDEALLRALLEEESKLSVGPAGRLSLMRHVAGGSVESTPERSSVRMGSPVRLVEGA